MSVYLQYNNATNFNNLMAGLTPLLSISVDDFHRDYFDIDTCNAQGLANWGRILGQGNSIDVPDYRYKIGFGDVHNPHNTVDYPQNFYRSNFYGGEFITQVLTDDQYRKLLKLTYLFQNTNSSVQSFNHNLNIYVQGQNTSYKARVVDNQDMTMRIEFNYLPQDFEIVVFKKRQFLSIPMGVKHFLSYNQIF